MPETPKSLILLRSSKTAVGSPLTVAVPATISFAGKKATKRFIEFFTVNIRNKNTRHAYFTAVERFFIWTEELTIALVDIEPVHVASYIEWITQQHSAPTVKQHLAAIRMLFDWLVLGQIVPMNPASVVRGPKHSLKKGKTPVLSPEEARQLFDGIDVSTIVGLRDRALLALMTYSFARVSAALQMNVEDLFSQRSQWWVRLHEKGGKHHDVPAHHLLVAYLQGYINAARLTEHSKKPLFQSIRGRTDSPTGNRLSRVNAYHMIRRRIAQSGIKTRVNCHTFRATGITAYLLNGGILEHAQRIANHESPTTTKLYDRTADEVTFEEIERIQI